MQPLQSLPWTEPLEMAAALDEPHWMLLYSGTRASYSGRYSYLACDMLESVTGSSFAPLAPKLSHDRPRFDNAWFGYFGYGLKNSLEALAEDEPNWISLPALHMMRFGTIIRFDHEAGSVQLLSGRVPPMPAGAKRQIAAPRVESLASNMTREEYLAHVRGIIERIREGELYQANLTRKFRGRFSETPDAFSLFRTLATVSPAPYSAFLRLGDSCILSSSPELFLRADASGRITTRPIKGTAPRFADPVRDRQSYEALAASAKDRAENLMIVDLMRNDLSRSCIPGSVHAEGLFEVTSHAAVHHMSSTVTGQMRPGCTILDAIARCFPPGSMTGAPKIRAMNLCSEMEKLERGVYSGAIGWLGGDGSCELSVVIRTLILQGDEFEFQVGGAIVADSVPEQELQETIDKSKGILSALGIAIENAPF